MLLSHLLWETTGGQFAGSGINDGQCHKERESWENSS